MSVAINRRRGTTAEHTTFTGIAGEITIDTTKKTVVVHDNIAAGGFPLLREDASNNGQAATVRTNLGLGAMATQSVPNGIVKGNGSTVSAASAGTDYVTPASATTTAIALALALG